MPAPSDPLRPPITPDAVVDAAAGLTRRSHLLGWSMRDLTRALDVSPSVVYHHVGGKDMLSRRVVEHALHGLDSPDPDLPWTQWFHDLLEDLYPRLVAYPGSAKWLLMHGPTFPSVIPIVNVGVGVLERAGFGPIAGMAYATLLNTPLLTLSVGDDRLVHEDDGPRDHRRMMDEFREAAAEQPGVEVLTEAFIRRFAESPASRERQRSANYRFVVETVIAGLAQRLETGVDLEEGNAKSGAEPYAYPHDLGAGPPLTRNHADSRPHESD